MACLNSDLYGMVQLPKRWFDMLSLGLQEYDTGPSYYDLCLFMGENVICVIYVNDCLLFSKEDKYIYAIFEKCVIMNLNSNMNIKVLMASMV